MLWRDYSYACKRNARGRDVGAKTMKPIQFRKSACSHSLVRSHRSRTPNISHNSAQHWHSGLKVSRELHVAAAYLMKLTGFVASLFFSFSLLRVKSEYENEFLLFKMHLMRKIMMIFGAVSISRSFHHILYILEPCTALTWLGFNGFLTRQPILGK